MIVASQEVGMQWVVVDLLWASCRLRFHSGQQMGGARAKLRVHPGTETWDVRVLDIINELLYQKVRRQFGLGAGWLP